MATTTSKNYHLGVWTQQPEQKGFTIVPLVPLSKVEFEAYERAISTYRALTERRTHQVLERNHHRLTSMLDTYTNLERVGGSFRAIDTSALGTALMGELANWLASTRLYLETDRDFLVTTFGDDSTEVTRHARIKSTAFDTYSGYRFLYNLRDYSQHCGPPLSGLEVSRDADGRRVVDLYLDRDNLLASRFKWSRHASTLLASAPSHIALMPLITEAMAGLQMIEDEVLRVLLLHCAGSVPKMREAILSVKNVEGSPAIFSLSDGGPTDSSDMAHLSFPSEVMLDTVAEAACAPDPMKVARATKTPTAYPGDQLFANRQAASVLTTWLEHGGGGVETTDAINRETLSRQRRL